jgi:hypothetical protein
VETEFRASELSSFLGGGDDLGEQASLQGLLADLDEPLGKDVEVGGHAPFLPQWKASPTVKMGIAALARQGIKSDDQIDSSWLSAHGVSWAPPCQPDQTCVGPAPISLHGFAC